MPFESKTAVRWLIGVALRLVVVVITVTLLVLMFERGGWWIVACLMWLPINWAVVAYFGDDTKSASGEVFFGPD